MIEAEVRSCPVCRFSRTQLLGSLARNFPSVVSREQFDLFKCDECDLIFQSPLPTERDFKILYEESGQFDSSTYRDPERVKVILEYYTQCLQQMLSFVERRHLISILEVGAGLSWVCRAARESVPNVFTVAQDLSLECATECTWVDRYIVGSINDPRVDSFGRYDVISLTHVIEHLPDPVADMQRLASLLKPKGVILITCPHRPSNWREGEIGLQNWSSWSYNHVPGHLQYFSRGALEKLGRLCGLELTHWSLSDEDAAVEAFLVTK